MTSNRSLLSVADGILFHPQDFRSSELPPRKPGQPWILRSMESTCMQ